MSHKSWILFVPLLLLGAALFLARPVAAGLPPGGVHPQVVYQTPTAQPDGRVVYIVQDSDSCLRIQLLTNVTVEQIRQLNNLDEACTIRPGQELLLTIVTPVASPTPNPQFTATALLPTPTPFNGSGEVCVLLFNDVNGNSLREETELPLGGGAVSVTEQRGATSLTGNTSELNEPVCNTVPEGEYNISMAIPGGFNATTEMNKPLKVQAGDQHTLEFGAQESSKQPEAPDAEPAADNSLLLAILGGILILGGAGLGVYVLFSRRG